MQYAAANWTGCIQPKQRIQESLFNLEAYPDGNIHALPDKEEKTIVMELLPLFLMQSASVILQSDNGREL
jgi:hypothetical protein